MNRMSQEMPTSYLYRKAQSCFAEKKSHRAFTKSNTEWCGTLYYQITDEQVFFFLIDVLK